VSKKGAQRYIWRGPHRPEAGDPERPSPEAAIFARTSEGKAAGRRYIHLYAADCRARGYGKEVVVTERTAPRRHGRRLCEENRHWCCRAAFLALQSIMSRASYCAVLRGVRDSHSRPARPRDYRAIGPVDAGDCLQRRPIRATRRWRRISAPAGRRRRSRRYGGPHHIRTVAVI